MHAAHVKELAERLVLGSLLETLRENHGPYELVAHWTQGEFHHDVVLALREQSTFLVVATNCNGGVKEVLAFDEVPDRWALWHDRCPDNPEFTGTLRPPRAIARTLHWFDPCELLVENARSELLPEYRERQRGGGWCKKAEK